jgi:phosphatidylglycerophosphatase C
MRRMNNASPIVVFDFDLTLTRWDTADRFFRWLLRREPWRFALVLTAAPVLGPLLLFNTTRKWPVRFAVWVATLGRSAQDLSFLAQEHVEAVFAGSEPVILQSGFERLRIHLEQGHRVVIATGCLEALAQKVLDKAGYGHVSLVASSLKPFLGGLVRHHHCFGPNKIAMLTERGFPPPWAIAYTDHRADIPLLRHAAEWFLINPKPKCVACIERVLSTKARVLAWT